MTQLISQLDGPMTQIVSALKSAAISAEHRDVMQQLVEKARPHLRAELLERYDERQRQLTRPLGERLSSLVAETEYVRDPKITDDLSATLQVHTIARSFGLSVSEALKLSEIQLAASDPMATYKLISALRALAVISAEKHSIA